MKTVNFENLAGDIKKWAENLGFQEARIANVDLSAYENSFKEWIRNKFHGEMEYMERHQDIRLHPERLLPGTIRVISVRVDYKNTKENSLLFRQNRIPSFSRNLDLLGFK